ncbi:MAG: hypothetical protein L0G22_13780, partial [Propionibacteriaceae bacterium]|nr:hypothetical protein [Propionibacteriaceae bacterium]
MRVPAPQPDERALIFISPDHHVVLLEWFSVEPRAIPPIAAKGPGMLSKLERTLAGGVVAVSALVGLGLGANH